MFPAAHQPGSQLRLSLEPERRVFRVSDLNAAVQQIFEADFHSIFVTGEISGCRQAASGHFYFALKDEQSQIKCVLFKGTARFARFKPQEGLAVIARGNLEVYTARGEYQLIVDLLEPQGAGALQLAYEQLKKKLAAEGLFEPARKRALPTLPRRIGIVTSPSGAVISDILHVLGRRFQGLHIRLFPAQVQGEGSVEQVCAGLRYFSASSWAEVVIVARGGGSIEDLWTFNEEIVARAIADCAVPVISAIGHETDFTIADLVADHRAPTPSAAAEIVICTSAGLIERIEGCRSHAIQAMRYRLLGASHDWHQLGIDRAVRLTNRRIQQSAQRLDDLDARLRATDLRLRFTRLRHRAELLHGNLANAQQSRLRHLQQKSNELAGGLRASDLKSRCSAFRTRIASLHERLIKAEQTRFERLKMHGHALASHLDQLNPTAVLARGYAIVENSLGSILRSSTEAVSGDSVRIRLHRGQLDARVTFSRDADSEESSKT